MPIVSRTLVQINDRLWRVDGVDASGRSWCHGPFRVANQTLAEGVRDSVFTQNDLEDADERDGVAFILNGGDPEDYIRKDMTLTEWRRRIAKKFWRSTIDDDRDFLVKAAPYIASFTATQIATALGITEQKAQLGIDKAVLIRDTLADAMASVDAQAEEV